jgi:protein-tyrosine phosphatase
VNWIDDSLAVGGWGDLRRSNLYGVDVVADIRPLFYTYGVKVDEIFEAVDELIYTTQDQRVLIRCFSGKDRAPFVAMVYVSKKYGMSYEEAYEFVHEKRPQTVYHWEWVEALRKQY